MADDRAALEGAMVQYRDLVAVPTVDGGEPLVPLPRTGGLTVAPIDPEMRKFTGSDIYLRKGPAARLGIAAQELQRVRPDAALQVVYGYRAPDIQVSLFEKFRAQLSSSVPEEDLVEATHRLVAAPEVAGHPTGGAIDVQIIEGGMPLDFGTRIWEFVAQSYVFSPGLRELARQNRKLLRSLLTDVGFAPFDGEWWHFSYGDREWAFYYDQPSALYGPVDFQISGK